MQVKVKKSNPLYLQKMKNAIKKIAGYVALMEIYGRIKKKTNESAIIKLNANNSVNSFTLLNDDNSKLNPPKTKISIYFYNI